MHFNRLIFLFKGIIYIKPFIGKDNNLSGKGLPNICENLFLNSPKFFSYKTSFPKSISIVPGKDAKMYSEPSPTSMMELFW